MVPPSSPLSFQTMKTIEYEPRLDIPGWMKEIELRWLFEQATHMKSIVEVGSWMGRSTHALCSGCLGRVFAVDHFRGSPSELNTNHHLAELIDIYPRFQFYVGDLPNLNVLKLSSSNAVKCFIPASVDMVFLDGDHTINAIREDLRIWRPIPRKLLCGHDWDIISVRQAVQELNLPIELGPMLLWAIRLE